MKNFGYTVLPDDTIDLDRTDRGTAGFLSAREPTLDLCIGCGSCTATCSTGHFTGFNIRMIHTLARRGELRKMQKDLPRCMFCGKCQLVCPRGVNLRNLILAMHRALEQL